MKTQQQISPSVVYCYSNLFLLLFYENNCIVGWKQKFPIRHSRILSIRRISDFGKSVGFRRIRIHNPSHPYRHH